MVNITLVEWLNIHKMLIVKYAQLQLKQLLNFSKTIQNNMIVFMIVWLKFAHVQQKNLALKISLKQPTYAYVVPTIMLKMLPIIENKFLKKQFLQQKKLKKNRLNVQDLKNFHSMTKASTSNQAILLQKETALTQLMSQKQCIKNYHQKLMNSSHL